MVSRRSSFLSPQTAMPCGHLSEGWQVHACRCGPNASLSQLRARTLGQADENPPVGLILCAEKDDAIAKYALEGLPNKVLAREYKLALPDEKRLAAEIEKTRDLLERRSRK
jgi:YhcG PDDEXK nuclease domain